MCQPFGEIIWNVITHDHFSETLTKQKNCGQGFVEPTTMQGYEILY